MASHSASFTNATQVHRLDSHTYSVNLDKAYSIGAVPNGGYVASCILSAARAHLEARGQPDTLSAHFHFPNRTTVGPAIVTIDDIKIGSQLSMLQLTLWQGGLSLSQSPWIQPDSRRCVVTYTSRINQETYTGMTIPTGYESSPEASLPSPEPDFARLKAGRRDEGWEEATTPPGVVVPSLRKWRFFHPRGGRPLSPGVLDLWMSLASGERITSSVLPYLADSFPFSLHLFIMDQDLRDMLEAPKEPADDMKSRSTNKAEGRDDPRDEMWFPTIAMSMEVKTALPHEGVEWLNMRITTKQMKDGKFDLDVLIRDVNGQLVALSNQVALISTMEKNKSKKKASL
ncbi:thioesterase-like superfamily-domain-containing protein [Coniella lustricola]|uniref:Thioesterase-like superfamily-domain-containing protein n=1 Tax=Coniella lustricola TaxID=2025994 RepID=A0A2T3A0G9_9PEZI|nr:thioesterase-like superfamily-domain-containing protein [Coniella lustricola]